MLSRQFLALTVLSTAVAAQQWTKSQDFSGASFFDGFKYNESAIDYNNFGNVHFLGQAAAVNANLTYINTNGQAILKVDNTTNGVGDPTFGRNTVYLMSKELFTINSLLVFDATHIPFGCSVWPALFTQGQNWPEDGEIDIVENVNLATRNQYSLHADTSHGTCVQPQGLQQTGTATSTNCTVVPTLNQNTGCVVQSSSTNSFGSGFVSSGGGVYATLWDDNGISMWFFERSRVPNSIESNPDPSSWSEPDAFYPASGCDPKTVFGPQIITLYINICGAFAGNEGVFESTCGSVAPNCSSLVPNPANYNDAYWAINYLRVFTNSSSSSSASGSPTGSSTGSTATGGSDSNSAVSVTASMMLASMLMVIFAIASLF
ncbi:glycoside hydrolase family 16 protein [Moniliophthora roreri]|nr:glycoside hydrolase family 16 protein [Moniliophthora roreri]